MKWQEISVTVDRHGVEAVSSILHDIGAGGVIIEDPQLKLQYIEEQRWDYYEFEDEPVIDQDTVVIKAYLPQTESLPHKVEEMKSAIWQLKTENLPGLKVDMAFAEVQEEDWATSWKAYYKPELVGEKIVIKPTWEDYEPSFGQIVVELDPGMAFGTGTHPTTSMCIGFLEKYINETPLVYDVGTGSGVLSICAAMLGAEAVKAVDLDDNAVRVARENVNLNGVAEVVEVLEGNLLDLLQEPADVIVANIIADVIICMAPDVNRLLKHKGIFIASGIIEERLDEVLDNLKAAGFGILEQNRIGGWAAIAATKESDNE